ncbi:MULTISPECIES: SDR family oxidoreductase [Streptomyces]|uniref:SDR family oxidoreductase n=1 Tax=Streptomyces TaxID=1883 RepID=UPI0030E2C816
MSRSVLISGGNRGIGLAVARAFAEAGDRVAVTYRSGTPPEGFLAVPCDVTDTKSVEAAFDTVEREQGTVEVLVANAGTTRDGLVLAMDDDDFLDVVDTNLAGAFRMARRAAGGMLEQRWGRLLFVSSAVAAMGGAGQANYAASKAGLVGFARSLAWELGSRGITSNVVAPGPVETDMSAAVDPARLEWVLGASALGRMGAPEDVAAVVRFLAGDEARFVTGAVVPVSGGFAMGA